MEFSLLHKGRRTLSSYLGKEREILPICGELHQTFYVGFVTLEDESFHLINAQYNPFAARRTVLALNEISHLTKDTIDTLFQSFKLNDTQGLDTLSDQISTDLAQSLLAQSIPVTETIRWFSQRNMNIDPRAMAKENHRHPDKIIERVLDMYSQENLVIDGLTEEYVQAITYLSQPQNQDYDTVLPYITRYNQLAQNIFPSLLSGMKGHMNSLLQRETLAYELSHSQTPKRILTQHSHSIQGQKAILEYFARPVAHSSVMQREASLFTHSEFALRNFVQQEKMKINARCSFLTPTEDPILIDELNDESKSIIAYVNTYVKEYMDEVYTYE